jgi:hypothetical protein
MIFKIYLARKVEIDMAASGYGADSNLLKSWPMGCDWATLIRDKSF